MAETPTLYASGTQSATVTTEHFLSSPNAAGVYQLIVDTSGMLAGDVLELRCYQIVLTGGTSRVAHYARFEGAQPADDYIKTGPLMANDLTDTNSLRFSLKQTYGTSRSYAYKVLAF